MWQRKSLNIGIATTWFGQDLKGGAEQQAWQLAHRLKDSGYRVRILTTCARSFLESWDENFYDPGLSIDHGLEVLRFPVGKRNSRIFNQVVGKLLSCEKNQLVPGMSPVNKETEQIYWSQNIHSDAMNGWIKEHSEQFHAVILMPYLFPVARDGVRTLGKKALLQPCLHDECYAYLSGTFESFEACGGLLFNSRGEYLLARKLMGEWIDVKSWIVGEGLEFGASTGEKRVNSPLSCGSPYLLCLGRRCEEKNSPFLAREFSSFYISERPDLKLVFAGPEKLPEYAQGKGIVDLGLVSEERKTDLLQGCRALVNPSTNESFSRVIFEAWNLSRPVLVHKDCLATATAVKDSGGGGWLAGNAEEWHQAFRNLEAAHPQELMAAGAKGQKYATKMTSWPEVLDRYARVFDSVNQSGITESCDRKPGLVVLPWPERVPAEYRKDVSALLEHLAGFSSSVFLYCPDSQQANGMPFTTIRTEGLRDSSFRRFGRIVWYSGLEWRGGMQALEGFEARRYLRLTSLNLQDNIPPSLKKLFPRILTPCSRRKGAETTDFLPDLGLDFEYRRQKFPPQLTGHILNCHQNVLVFTGQKYNYLKLLSMVAKKFQEIYDGSVKFYLPQSGKIRGHEEHGIAKVISPDPDSLAGYWYACDLALICGDVRAWLGEIENIGVYGVPALCLDSQHVAEIYNLPFVDLRKWDEDVLKAVCAFIKLCSGDGIFRKTAQEQNVRTGRKIRSARSREYIKTLFAE